LATAEQKLNADLVEFFKKSNIFITQIAMSKFHTVFLSKTGLVYSCGFGMDGRLGHDNEATLVAPKQIDKLKDVRIAQIAASRNNTYFLDNNGCVYSCGSNEFKQLGQSGAAGKALTPKKIDLTKRLKGKRITQIACSRFHCVLLTNSSELFTFGLNAGQLGHPNEMQPSAASANYNSTICFIGEPRLVASLANDADVEISLIACSDGCTVCLQTSKPILHIFNDYKCKRLHYLKEVGTQFIRIGCIGGRLDSCGAAAGKAGDVKWIEDLGDPLVIVGLTDKASLFVWREIEPVWRQLTWSVNKNFKIVDFDLNKFGLIVATDQGTCYTAEFRAVARPTDSKSETLELNRVSSVNRCVKVACDLKGRNYFALQYQPTVSMRYHPEQVKSQFRDNMRTFVQETNSEDVYADSFFDLKLTFKELTFKAHKFILLSRCGKFFSKCELREASELDLTRHLDVTKLTPDVVDLILKLIYQSQVDSAYLTQMIRKAKINTEASFGRFLSAFKETLCEKLGLIEFKQAIELQLPNLKQLKVDSKGVEERLVLLADFLSNILKSALIQPRANRRHFTRFSYQDYYDCKIDCNKGESLMCHKCVLIARSEFFRNMFLGGWLESSLQCVTLPFDLDLVEMLVDYLYTDELLTLVNSSSSISHRQSDSLKSKIEIEMELLINLYLLSDQLLVVRLKNLCEFRLAYLVNFKNCAELFEFDCVYEARQLRDYCMEFMARNLATIVEMKQLESLDFDLLRQLAAFYRTYFPLVDSRRLTAYSYGLEPSKIDLIPEELAYDERFVLGFVEADNLSRKKTTTNSLSTSIVVDDEKDRKAETVEANESELVAPIVPLVSINQKWELAGKKVGFN
jgi:hypothetical protein